MKAADEPLYVVRYRATGEIRLAVEIAVRFHFDTLSTQELNGHRHWCMGRLLSHPHPKHSGNWAHHYQITIDLCKVLLVERMMLDGDLPF